MFFILFSEKQNNRSSRQKNHKDHEIILGPESKQCHKDQTFIMLVPLVRLHFFQMNIKHSHAPEREHGIHPNQQQRRDSGHTASIQQADRNRQLRFFQYLLTDFHQKDTNTQDQDQIDHTSHPGSNLIGKNRTHCMKGHKMKRRMIVVFHIKINR